MAKKKLVYICSPFSGDVAGNTIKAREYSRFAFEQGVIPFTAHLLFPQFVMEETERELAMQMDMEMLEKCDEIWVFGAEERLSAGMKAEIEYAEQLGMTIRFYMAEMKEEK